MSRLEMMMRIRGFRRHRRFWMYYSHTKVWRGVWHFGYLQAAPKDTIGPQLLKLSCQGVNKLATMEQHGGF